MFFSGITLCRLPSHHQFWAHAPMEEEVENKEFLAESRSRYISFPGSFSPVSHFCRARLDNGLLCQRQDRLKVTGQTKQQTKRISFYNRSFCFPAVSISRSHYSQRWNGSTHQWERPIEGGEGGKNEEGRTDWWGANTDIHITRKKLARYACILMSLFC